LDYPISIIYESGFISNPEEEKLLATKEYAEKLTDAQYAALLETIKEVFRVDISKKAKKLSKNKASRNTVEMMKLSRIAVYYLKLADTSRFFATVKAMENKAGKEFAANSACFSAIKNKIEHSEKLYGMGKAAYGAKKTNKKKARAKAASYYKKAYNALTYSPAYRAYKNKYTSALGVQKNTRVASSGAGGAASRKKESNSFVYSQKAPKLRTIILTVEEGQSAEAAIEAALAPDNETLKKLAASFKKAVDFEKGIYLISINNDLKVTKANKVSGVLLDPWKYQNQQYLKNSYFAPNLMEKSL
jgi:hypothetical protein